MTRVWPQARKVDQTDTYHGVEVADPYRWMEDAADPDLKVWLDAQLEITEEVLDAAGCRTRFRERLAGLVRSGGVGPPVFRGGRCFQSRGEAGRDASIYLVDAPGGQGRAVFTISSEVDVVIADAEPSPDGTKLKWCESVGGSDWRTWRVLDVESGEMLPDAITDAKLWSYWLPDSSGLLYMAFPSDGEGATRQTAIPQLKMHRFGESEDPIVYENRENPTYFYASVSDDGRYIVMTFLYAPGGSIAVAPIEGPWDFKTIFESDDPIWLAGTRGDKFYVTTTNDAPYGKVVSVDASGEVGDTVVEATDVPLPVVARSTVVGDWIFVARDQLGRSSITMHALDGSEVYDVDLPETCRFVMHGIEEPVTTDGKAVWFSVTSPNSPGSLLRHDIETRKTTVEFSSDLSVDLDIEAEVVWTTSRDGTKVPMTLVRARGVSEDPAPPVLIQGYGGGGDSMEPYDFVPWKVPWMEAGGVVASAHIRGGGELGADWQAQAARGGKLLAMEDFIGCAEWLVDNGYTKTERIAITGRSSGAMLAAAAVVQRPELFASCVAEVGMFDPLRYHLFGLGKLMIPEYGTSDDPDDFKAMIAYSPQQNVQAGVAYPPMLLTVHTDDDRVMPGGPYKFAAAMQDAQSGDAPIVLRLRAGAGHHGGVSVEDEVAERADILAFLAHTLGVPGC